MVARPRPRFDRILGVTVDSFEGHVLPEADGKGKDWATYLLPVTAKRARVLLDDPGC